MVAVSDGLLAIVAGFIGALAMTALGRLPRLVDWPYFDFGELIAVKLLRVSFAHGTSLGTGLHLAIGALLGVLYAAIVHPLLPLPAAISGMLYGVVLWLGMMVIVLPFLGETAFGSSMGRPLAFITLALHLVYGAILGLLYRLPVIRA